MNIENIAKHAKEASYKLASLSSELKNNALIAVADNILKNSELILAENKKDLEIALQAGMASAPYNRLKLDNDKIHTIIQGIKDLVNLEDPVHKVLMSTELDTDLELYKVTYPIGVIGVIFESRPDVVPQIASLAIKSANAVILKGGSEAAFSNEIFVNVISEALSSVDGFPENAINIVKTRDDVTKMLALDEYIDLIIPRGSNALVKHIQSNTRIPVLGHADGICHIYIDNEADLEKAVRISVDSKTQYPSACNAVETILINKELSKDFINTVVDGLKNAEVVVKGDDFVQACAAGVEHADEEDWKTEYGEKIVSIKAVSSLIEAIDHINHYGSGHTDSIITENKQKAEVFMDLVDSAGVYHNASTRFADGFRYGFGAEVGISTNKTHARGPVGIDGLVIYKYKLYGKGQIVAEYAGATAKKFTHKKL